MLIRRCFLSIVRASNAAFFYGVLLKFYDQGLLFYRNGTPAGDEAMMRFRISHKIDAIGLIGFGGLALVGGIYLAGDAAQETYRVVAADARVISDQVDRLARDLLESRRAEKDFLLRNDEKY